MTKLSRYQQKQCLKILNKLIEKTISKPFQENLSENFGLPNPIHVYLEKPIDLSTIRENLKNDKYKSIQEWGRDVFLVFDNALALFNSGSPINAMAKDLRNWFEKKIKNFPRTANEKWLIEFNIAHEKLQKLVDSYPKSKNSSYNTSYYSQDEESPHSSQFSQKSSHNRHDNENNSNHAKILKPTEIKRDSHHDKNDDLEDDLEDDNSHASYHTKSKMISQAIIADDSKNQEKKKMDSIQLFPGLD